MYHDLLEEAKEAGIKDIVISLIVKAQDKLLLLENPVKPGDTDGLYVLPSTRLKAQESISQGIQRGLMESTGLDLKDVVAYLGYQDFRTTREYTFVVIALDPYGVGPSDHIAYSWVNIGDAVGYPISDTLRQTLDLFEKLVS